MMSQGHGDDGWVNIVTHIHTNASRPEASELNDRISDAIHRIDGQDSPLTWAECFTPIEVLEDILRRGKGDHGAVHIILVTDHMRKRYHKLSDHHLEIAARTRRIAIGAELATRTRDIDGRYHQGPEILAYGSPNLVDGPHGPYFGLTQDLLEELYDTCMDDDGRELCTRRARQFLLRRNIVHGLSHPFDGHGLSLEGTLAIIGEFPFVETTNGGYSARSAELLDAFIKLNNALLKGGHLPKGELSETGRRIVDHIQHHGRYIYPLSGSDAHSHDFDRVVTSMPVPIGRKPEDITPGDLFGRMLVLANDQRSSPFVTRGEAASVRTLLSDVIAIVGRNVKVNLKVCKDPIRWGKVAATTFWITRDELRQRRDLQRRRVHDLETDFDPVHLLDALEPEAVSRSEASSPKLPLRVKQLG